MVYKWCVVPQCTSTTISTPEKLFVSVPMEAKRRKRWLELARRDPKSIGANSNVFMCEDHFNMEKDVANYMQYKMGYSQKILLADRVLPSKFYCQDDRKRRLCDPSTSRAVIEKRQRMNRIKECEKESLLHEENIIETSVEKKENVMHKTIESESQEIPKTQDKETITDSSVTAEKSVQVAVKLHYRSKSMQTMFPKKHISTSPLKVSTTSSYTSPFKVEPCHRRPSTSGYNATKKTIFTEDEKSDSDVSCFTEAVTAHYSSSSGAPSLSSKVSDSDSYVMATNEDIEKLQCLKNTMRLIHRKPSMYVGISNECYFIINLIHKHTDIQIEHIMLCLKKIRLNSTFSVLEDNFGISLSYASKLFLKNIPIIASILHPFIVNLNKHSVKKNLPVAFRHNYHNVSCIIDCLEIDIQKPSKALHQALTWSDYKKGNTVKYLISCTPNGLVNYISPGFGGRTSDVTIVENCDFLDGLQKGTFILADRGFKHIEQILDAKGIKLLRPPSVTAGSKLTKAEVRQTKIIASLRIHVERVIRRLREFHMLKQHSVINSNILRVLDHVIIIACALINLQDSLIK